MWQVVELGQGRLCVRQVKAGAASVHPLRGPDIRTLRQLYRESPRSPYLFVSERGGPLNTTTVRKMVARADRAAALLLSRSSHMLRHVTGYKLANEGHDTRAIQHYLVHENIQHTIRYTQLSSIRFRDFWQN